ncbi:MAG: NlpC/P60 family protein [Chlorobium sp.]|nr:MAG: NlpC/P60 family protein [Chlorobium sp.]
MTRHQNFSLLFKLPPVPKKISVFAKYITVCVLASIFQFAEPNIGRCDGTPDNTPSNVSQASTVGSPRFSTAMQSFFAHVGQYFGTRYRFGGQTPAGFDCSGFVRFMYNKVFNMHLPRSSKEMSAIGNKVSKNELQPGDLVFFQTKGLHINHVGIFIGNDTFVHSSLSKGITEDQLKNYYEKKFAGAVRLLDLSADKLPSLPIQEQSKNNSTEPS